MSRETKEGRADETQPPLGGGTPEPPLAESPTLPVGKVRVFGDASATYGSMIPPEAIRPWADEVDEATEPARKRQEKGREKESEPGEKRAFGYVDAKDDQAVFVHAKEPPLKIRRYPGEGDPIGYEFDPNPGLYVEKKDKAPKAEGEAAEDERNLKREAKEDKPEAKGPHDR